MEESDKELILKLFFDNVWSIEKIEDYFNEKYTYTEIRKVIWERYKITQM